jgi:hypothetical protein
MQPDRVLLYHVGDGLDVPPVTRGKRIHVKLGIYSIHVYNVHLCM